MNIIPAIQTTSEVALIKAFIKRTLHKTNHENVIIAVSGGIDSATSLNLLYKALPKKNIFVVHLYYFEKSIEQFREVIDPLSLPEENILLYSIKDIVDATVQNVSAENDSIRTGNIMARIRMIHVFDLAKKHKALVCGTENRSEYHLGYFTRFGDAASDFELINHLYKTQVRQLASYLRVPQSIIDAAPSAGLWEGQTDEQEMGFSYEEADPVLYLYFDKNKPIEEIKQEGFINADTIIEAAKRNSFKHKVPYVMG